jgi:hypothetical protein
MRRLMLVLLFATFGAGLLPGPAAAACPIRTDLQAATTCEALGWDAGYRYRAWRLTAAAPAVAEIWLYEVAPGQHFIVGPSAAALPVHRFDAAPAAGQRTVVAGGVRTEVADFARDGLACIAFDRGFGPASAHLANTPPMHRLLGFACPPNGQALTPDRADTLVAGLAADPAQMTGSRSGTASWAGDVLAGRKVTADDFDEIQ